MAYCTECGCKAETSWKFCQRCGQKLIGTSAAPQAKPQEQDTNIGKTCPYCQVPIKRGTDMVLCKECHMPHHRTCWQENGNRCTTFGCAGITFVNAGEAPASMKLETMGISPTVKIDSEDEDRFITCPHCAQHIYLSKGNGMDGIRPQPVLARQARHNDWLLMPFERAGVIEKDWTWMRLSAEFGQTNLYEKTVVLPNQTKSFPATVIGKGTTEQLMVVWCDQDREKIAWVEASMPSPVQNSKWRLENGLFSGMGLKDVQRIAGKPFPFFRFSQSIGGMILFLDQGGIYDYSAGIQLRMAFVAEGNLPAIYSAVYSGQRSGGVIHSDSPYVEDDIECFRLDVIAVAMTMIPEVVRG